MKAFILALAALVVISFGANRVLNEIGFSSAQTSASGPSVRLSD